MTIELSVNINFLAWSRSGSCLELTVSKAVGNQTPHDLRNTIHRIPVRRAKRLLGTAPPHLRYRNTARGDQRLERPQEEPQSYK